MSTSSLFQHHGSSQALSTKSFQFSPSSRRRPCPPRTRSPSTRRLPTALRVASSGRHKQRASPPTPSKVSQSIARSKTGSKRWCVHRVSAITLQCTLKLLRSHTTLTTSQSGQYAGRARTAGSTTWPRLRRVATARLRSASKHVGGYCSLKLLRRATESEPELPVCCGKTPRRANALHESTFYGGTAC